MSTIAAWLLLAGTAQGVSPPPAAEVGQVHELSKRYETAQQSSGGSSGTSRGRDAMVERVLATSDAGLELEFDLPDAATPEDRSRHWQFPVRVLKPASGPMQVLNWPELDARLDVWLAGAGLTRAQCGQWIFTWNAFRIDCDPASVIAALEGFDIGHARLREGDAYHDDGAEAPGTLQRLSPDSDNVRLSATLDIDPGAVRHARAETDVAVGEMTGQPVSLEAALANRNEEAVSGTITVTFDLDADGKPWRRTRVTKLEIKTAGGETENQTVTETVERRLLRDGGDSEEAAG